MAEHPEHTSPDCPICKAIAENACTLSAVGKFAGKQVLHRIEVDGLASRLRHLAEASRSFGSTLALRQATWEPHDWSTF